VVLINKQHIAMLSLIEVGTYLSKYMYVIDVNQNVTNHILA
jgi:hypothetical protein